MIFIDSSRFFYLEIPMSEKLKINVCMLVYPPKLIFTPDKALSHIPAVLAKLICNFERILNNNLFCISVIVLTAPGLSNKSKLPTSIRGNKIFSKKSLRPNHFQAEIIINQRCDQTWKKFIFVIHTHT